MECLFKWRNAAILYLASAALSANPYNPTVVSGSVSFDNPNANTLRVTASDLSIIDWEGFSIALGEVTKFIQPSSSASVLNRVTGFDLSSIQGSLQANGGVLLINPNGVLIGASSIVNTSSFLASTLDVMNSEFLAGGDMNFAGSSMEAVTNLGTVNGWSGDVVFIARTVDHQGEVNAPQGAALIGAGHNVLLKADGPDRIFIQPSMGMMGGNGIDASGVIQAVQAELKAEGNLYALAINMTGMIEADADGMDAGSIVLSAEGGMTRVDGFLKAVNGNNTGGMVQVLGQTVEVKPATVVDVSGLNGGGIAVIGGNVPDQEPTVYNSQSTTVDDGAVFLGSAFGYGDGGIITVWSDQDTEYRGSSTSEGGAIGGNGGRVQIAGRSSLVVTGRGATLAPFGDGGLTAMGSSNLDVRAGQLPNPPANTVDTALIVDDFSTNQFVILATLAEFPGTRDVIFYDPLVWSTPSGLYVISGNDVALHASVQHTGSDNVAFFYAKPDRDMIVRPDFGSMTVAIPNAKIEWYPDRDLVVQAADHDFGSVQILGNELLLQSGRNMNLMGGAGMNSSVSVSAATDCELQTGLVEARGYLHVQGGDGVDADVHLPSTEITSFGPNS